MEAKREWSSIVLCRAQGLKLTERWGQPKKIQQLYNKLRYGRQAKQNYCYALCNWYCFPANKKDMQVLRSTLIHWWEFWWILAMYWFLKTAGEKFIQQLYRYQNLLNFFVHHSADDDVRRLHVHFCTTTGGQNKDENPKCIKCCFTHTVQRHTRAREAQFSSIIRI